MKTYEMIQANSEKITVSSMEQANRVMAGFEPYADKFLADVGATTSIDDELFAFFQRIAVRWNANYEVWKVMDADDELKLVEMKAADTQRAQAIRDMARKCRDG